MRNRGWWRTPLIPASTREAGGSLGVGDEPGFHIEFHTSQGSVTQTLSPKKEKNSPPRTVTCSSDMKEGMRGEHPVPGMRVGPEFPDTPTLRRALGTIRLGKGSARGRAAEVQLGLWPGRRLWEPPPTAHTSELQLGPQPGRCLGEPPHPAGSSGLQLGHTSSEPWPGHGCCSSWPSGVRACPPVSPSRLPPSLAAAEPIPWYHFCRDGWDPWPPGFEASHPLPDGVSAGPAVLLGDIEKETHPQLVV